MPEGEVQQPPKEDEQQNDQENSQQQQNPPATSGTTPPKPDDKGGDGDGTPTLEDQLDAEKQKNLQLSKDLQKANQAAA